MKVIGLIGGMSWESTAHYYRLINSYVKEKLGGLHSARLLLFSVDFDEIEKSQSSGNWQQATDTLIDAARRLKAGGAECLVICTNTMHKMADEVQASANLPLIHIADATAQAVKSAGIRKIGLLGTRYTMEQKFYRGRLEDAHTLEVITPDAAGRELVHRVIYDELCLGQVKAPSRDEFLRIIKELESRGAEGVILGCTELGLLVKPGDSVMPLFDTTEIHACAAANWSLE